MNQRCGCGNDFQDPIEGQPRPWYWLDSGARLCRHCIREAVVLAGHREDLAAAHFRDHGYELAGCFVCEDEREVVARRLQEWGR